jgi:hypothetical protein
MTEAEKTGLRILREGRSYAEAAEASGLTQAQLRALWASQPQPGRFVPREG